jgi:hypothetical protein
VLFLVLAAAHFVSYIPQREKLSATGAAMKLTIVRSAIIPLALVALTAATTNVRANRNASASTAAIPQFDSDAQCVSSVPRAWGEFKGGSAQSGLAFQAPDGTLRFLTNLPCGSQAVVALKIMRTGNAASN